MSIQKFGRTVAREIREVIPPTLFFFVAFGLLLLTQMLVLRDHGIDVWSWGGAVVGALLIGKIMLVVDKLPFVNRYPHKPLIWNALWKALIYNVAAVILRYIERMIHLWPEQGSFVAANATLIDQASWPHVVLVHMWLAVLLIVYCCLRELVRQIGADRVRRMFFQTSAA